MRLPAAMLALLSIPLVASPLLVVPLRAIAADAPPRELIADADIKIAADGAVSGYHLDGWLDHELANALEKQVTSWRFEPAQVDGRAVDARTHVLVTLQPKPLAPGTSVWQITDVSVGEPALARKRLLMPDYPLAALRAHLGARVVVVVRLDAAGKVTAVHAEQTSLTSPGDDTLAKQWREIFDDVTLRVAKGWKFRPVETVAGSPVGTTIRIPVVFVYYGDRAPLLPRPRGSRTVARSGRRRRCGSRCARRRRNRVAGVARPAGRPRPRPHPLARFASRLRHCVPMAAAAIR